MKFKLKFIAAFIVLFISCNFCFADKNTPRFKITDSTEEFNLLYYESSELKNTKNNQNRDVNVNQTFKFRGKDGIKAEIRYSLFTDINPDDEDIQFHYALWIYNLVNIVAGYEFPLQDITAMANNDVRNDFNGNFGCSAFIKNPKSDYARGYKYMRVEFYYKARQGLVMRSFLFNDLKFAGYDIKTGSFDNNSDYNNCYYTFKFMEKDENGNYIRK